MWGIFEMFITCIDIVAILLVPLEYLLEYFA
jgi:hypothetical protein